MLPKEYRVGQGGLSKKQSLAVRAASAKAKKEATSPRSPGRTGRAGRAGAASAASGVGNGAVARAYGMAPPPRFGGAAKKRDGLSSAASSVSQMGNMLLGAPFSAASSAVSTPNTVGGAVSGLRGMLRELGAENQKLFALNAAAGDATDYARSSAPTTPSAFGSVHTKLRFADSIASCDAALAHYGAIGGAKGGGGVMSDLKLAGMSGSASEAGLIKALSGVEARNRSPSARARGDRMDGQGGKQEWQKLVGHYSNDLKESQQLFM